MEKQEERQLRAQIQQDLHDALKARDTIRSATLRLVLAALKDQDIALRTKAQSDPADHSQIIAMLRTMIKQRHESVQAYERGGRKDRADMERKEIDVISTYLPPQWNEEKTEKMITKVLEDLQATGVKDMGRVMTHLQSTYGDEVNMALSGKLVREALLNDGKLA